MLPYVVPHVDKALLTKDAQQYSADKALYEKMFPTSNHSEADGRDGEAGAARASTIDMQTGRNEHRNFGGGRWSSVCCWRATSLWKRQSCLVSCRAMQRVGCFDLDVRLVPLVQYTCTVSNAYSEHSGSPGQLRARFLVVQLRPRRIRKRCRRRKKRQQRVNTLSTRCVSCNKRAEMLTSTDASSSHMCRVRMIECNKALECSRHRCQSLCRT